MLRRYELVRLQVWAARIHRAISKLLLDGNSHHREFWRRLPERPRTLRKALKS